MNHIILGGAGFIGSNLAKSLAIANSKIVILDDLSNGKLSYLDGIANEKLYFLQVDLSETLAPVTQDSIQNFLGDGDLSIWHLAANSDIQKGINNPRIDLKNTLSTTFTALELVKYFQPKIFVFASSSAIYGDKNGVPLSEEDSTFSPVSVYGSMKLASEIIIRGLKDFMDGTKVRIYRFPNVIGTPITHGVIHDFYYKLRLKPQILEVLGDGNQQKPYLYVSDLIEAMEYLNNTIHNFDIFNIGPNDSGIFVRTIAEFMRDSFSPASKIVFGNTPFGWKGDVPIYRFDNTKAKLSGLNLEFTSMSALERTIDALRLSE